MSCSISFNPLKALPSFSSPAQHTPFTIINQCKSPRNTSKNSNPSAVRCSRRESETSNKASLAIQIGALLSTGAEPAMAVTGVNYEPDLKVVVIKLGIIAFFYFLIVPPILMNWMRVRWYRRGLLEMYVQFMFTFIFFPGVLLWAPFLNFRKFPRDPSMKYPWSKPEDPSKIPGGFLKYPWAKAEDYD